MSQNYKKKILSIKELKKKIGSRPRKKKVIMCHGSFDIVHPGHIRHLMYAKKKSDILVASITCDKYIVKGNVRPYVPEELRALNLAVLDFVDYVIIDHNESPIKNLKSLKPDYFAKGYEYSENDIHPKTREEISVLKKYGGEIIFTPGDIVFSSTNIGENKGIRLEIEKLRVLMQSYSITFNDLRSTLKQFKNLKVHVIGDLILDKITNTTLISGGNKTPTCSVRFENEESFVGGAGIVAKHIKAAGADVTLTTVMGSDKSSKFAINNLKKFGVKTNVYFDKNRPTTIKNSFISQNYRLLKLDTVDNRPILSNSVDFILKSIKKNKSDIIIFSDFRHGIFNKSTISKFCKAIPSKILKVADSQVSSRWGNILDFENMDIITPNEKEARFSLNDQDSVIRPLGSKLYRKSNCKLLLMKLGEKGLLTICGKKDSQRNFYVLDSFADNVVDPVGAGDSLLAYAALSYKVGKSDLIASILGSFAASIECKYNGNIPITIKSIENMIEDLEKRTNL